MELLLITHMHAKLTAFNYETVKQNNGVMHTLKIMHKKYIRARRLA